MTAMYKNVFSKPIVMLSHTDLDGMGSPVVAKYFFTGEYAPEVYCVQNPDINKSIRRVMEERKGQDYLLLICDHSPSREVYDELVAEGVDFYVFDHHKMSEVIGLDRVIFDLKICGTKLFYDWLVDIFKDYEQTGAPAVLKKLEKFVYYVNDYDMWIHESPVSKRLNELLFETSITEFMERFVRNPLVVFTQTEDLLVDNAIKRRDAYIKRAQRKMTVKQDRDGNKIGIVFTESHQSELGNVTIIDYDLDYIFMINAQASKVSLRSAGEVDVALVSQDLHQHFNVSFGGHKAAAGFAFAPEDLPKAFELIYNY